MSIIGTGVAASVAQTALNAQQQARAVDKSRGEQQRVAADAAAAFVRRLQGTSHTDETGAELPDRQAPGYEQLYGPDGVLHCAADEATDAATAAGMSGDTECTHLDITG